MTFGLLTPLTVIALALTYVRRPVVPAFAVAEPRSHVTVVAQVRLASIVVLADWRANR